MKVAIIGGTGHIGSYLTPMLVEAGYEVTCVCLNQRTPYREHTSWNSIRYLWVDRIAEEQTGTFGERIRQLEAEAVIDLTCYQQNSAEHLVEALRGHVAHFLHCGNDLGPRVQ